MANEAMETLLQKMSELTTAIKDSKQPKQELQWDDVQAQFGEQLKGLNISCRQRLPIAAVGKSRRGQRQLTLNSKAGV